MAVQQHTPSAYLSDFKWKPYTRALLQGAMKKQNTTLFALKELAFGKLLGYKRRLKKMQEMLKTQNSHYSGVICANTKNMATSMLTAC